MFQPIHIETQSEQQSLMHLHGHTRTEDSITRLFAAQGVHILRQDRAPIRLSGDTLNLIGIDDSQPDIRVVKHLVMPDMVNILLVHDQAPNGFDQAVELGIDLTLAGHTHGGQLSLESFAAASVSPEWRRPTSADGTKKPAANFT